MKNQFPPNNIAILISRASDTTVNTVRVCDTGVIVLPFTVIALQTYKFKREHYINHTNKIFVFIIVLLS